jgi:phosphoribosylanthranilate isomerase|nr:MAG: N-(5'-phosphoribosyl)anthranilate isomerase [Bacteroidota bacterium]
MIDGIDVRIKICGMRDPKNIAEVGARRPDYMGFIFYQKSPRYVGENFNVPQSLSPSIKRVGVFVNASVDEIIATSKRHSLWGAQLHGRETPEQCAAVREAGYKVVKAFSVDATFDFSTTSAYRDVVDFFLFDTKGPLYGGNARRFDWNLLEKYDQSVPFFLSGGLAPENVAEVKHLTEMNVHALDINSGIESSPGVKDPARLNALLNAVTAALK